MLPLELRHYKPIQQMQELKVDTNTNFLLNNYIDLEDEEDKKIEYLNNYKRKNKLFIDLT